MIIYYRVFKKNMKCICEYWREGEKPIRLEFGCIDQERIRFRYEMATGLRGFELVEVKGD